MPYAQIVFLQGDDYSEFEAVMYPDRETASLGWQRNEAEALSYLAQWDYGEPSDEEPKDEYPFCFAGNDRTYEAEQYVMVWSPNFGVAGLWRKVTDNDSE